MEFDLDKALEEVPIHVEDPAPPSAMSGDLPPPPTSLDPKSVCLGDLLPVEHTTLEHRTKFRPKPKKRTKPSRVPVGLHQRRSRSNPEQEVTHRICSVPAFQRETTRSSAAQEPEQNSIMGKLDEGLDDFFSKKVIKLSFR